MRSQQDSAGGLRHLISLEGLTRDTLTAILDRAETYANLSIKVSSTFSFTMMSSDTPTKLLKEVQTARALAARKPAGTRKRA